MLKISRIRKLSNSEVLDTTNIKRLILEIKEKKKKRDVVGCFQHRSVETYRDIKKDRMSKRIKKENDIAIFADESAWNA